MRRDESKCTYSTSYILGIRKSVSYRAHNFHSVIMVAGGWVKGNTVELLNLDGSWHCSLPPIPENKSRDTLTGLVLCGGFNETVRKSCVRFSKGEEEWKKSHTLKESRRGHVAWNSPDGVLLMGGRNSPTTTELLTNNGDTTPGFKIK